jgi:hypothetical protein
METGQRKERKKPQGLDVRDVIPQEEIRVDGNINVLDSRQDIGSNDGIGVGCGGDSQ